MRPRLLALLAGTGLLYGWGLGGGSNRPALDVGNAVYKRLGEIVGAKGYHNPTT